MELRLGDLLVDNGVLTRDQVRQILDRQQETGEPFGILAERTFGVDPVAVEAAWARQYAGLTRTIDPEREPCVDEALTMLTRRQAWQFRVLPVRFEPPELMLATTQAYLPRALRFASNVIHYPVFFVMAEPAALGRAMCQHYPLPGLTPESVTDDGLDRMLTAVGSVR